MEGRSPEFIPNLPEKTDDGFSEAKSAKIAEGKGMDTKQVKKRKPVIPASSRLFSRGNPVSRPVRQRVVQPVDLSRKEKIVKSYQENAQALVALVEAYQHLDGTNLRQEEQLLLEIKDKQYIQEQLVHALVLEQRNQLSEETISKEAWALIK